MCRKSPPRPRPYNPLLTAMLLTPSFHFMIAGSFLVFISEDFVGGGLVFPFSCDWTRGGYFCPYPFGGGVFLFAMAFLVILTQKWARPGVKPFTRDCDLFIFFSFRLHQRDFLPFPLPFFFKNVGRGFLMAFYFGPPCEEGRFNVLQLFPLTERERNPFLLSVPQRVVDILPPLSFCGSGLMVFLSSFFEF